MSGSTLEVRLGSAVVGHIVRQDTFRCTVQLDERYLARSPRPILGQEFEDRNPHRVRIFEDAVPLWFSHLLPERGGFLRDIIARQTGVRELDDFDLLREMGADLPGAVIVCESDTAVVHDEAAADREVGGLAANSPSIRFALAGIQAKYSMTRDKDRGLVLSGQRGDEAWIVKTPDAVFENACENEYVVMSWAKAAGMDVPDIELVATSELKGLPASVPLHGPFAFAIRRFDRTARGRVHQEDFAQVLSRPVSAKYEGTSFDSLGNVILGMCGRGAFNDFMRRLVFTIASGNADAHLKNWSVQYLDGIHPSLSPVYDQLAVIAYPEKLAAQDLVLPLNKSKGFNQISLLSWQRMARITGIPEREIVDEARSAVDAIREAWVHVRNTLIPEVQVPPRFVELLEGHMAAVPLLRG